MELAKKPERTASRPLRVQGAFAGQIRFDHAEPLAQLKQLPALAAEDAHARARPSQGIALAGQRLDQRGLAATIRAEDGQMLVALHAQRNIVEHGLQAARHGNVLEFDESLSLHSHEFSRIVFSRIRCQAPERGQTNTMREARSRTASSRRRFRGARAAAATNAARCSSLSSSR